MVIPICGVNNFSIEQANSVTESLRSGESAVTVTMVTGFISAKYLCSGIFRVINMTKTRLIRLWSIEITFSFVFILVFFARI